MGTGLFYYVERNGNFLPMFRHYLSLPTSKVDPLKFVTRLCFET